MVNQHYARLLVGIVIYYSAASRKRSTRKTTIPCGIAVADACLQRHWTTLFGTWAEFFVDAVIVIIKISVFP